MDQCEDREEGAPPSKTTLCGEHESQTKAQRLAQSSCSPPFPTYSVDQTIVEPESGCLSLIGDEFIEPQFDFSPSMYFDDSESSCASSETDVCLHDPVIRPLKHLQLEQLGHHEAQRPFRSPNSSDSSSVSLTSNDSKETGINFKRKRFSGRKRPFLSPDSSPSDSSSVSLKSNDSKETGINFKRKHSHRKSPANSPHMSPLRPMDEPECVFSWTVTDEPGQSVPAWRVDQESSEGPSGQSAQQHQTQLDSIFIVCTCTTTTFKSDI